MPLVVAHEATPADQPAEWTLHHPALGQHPEPGLAKDALGHAHGELQKRRLVHQLAAVIRAVGKEVLQPRPIFADRIQDMLGAGTVGNVCRGQVDRQQSAAVSIAMCRLWPMVFLLASYPRAFAAGALTVWQSMTPAVGLEGVMNPGSVLRLA